MEKKKVLVNATIQVNVKRSISIFLSVSFIPQCDLNDSNIVMQ